MKLIPLPAFQDDDLWFLHDGQRALVADPGDAQPVVAALQREGLQLEAILVTHRIPEPATRWAEGDTIDLAALPRGNPGVLHT
jgi:hypothetical protein